MDRITIQNLEVFANHGVFPEENKLGQKFLVSAELLGDTRKAGVSDELKHSIHYGLVAEEITSYMKAHTKKLIEAAAEELAEHLLFTFPLMKGIVLEIKKPWAPIGLPLETVSVEIERGWHTAYIAFGSNMGNKEQYLNQAIRSLGRTSGCMVTKVSSFLVTEPYGVTDQDEFLNGCLMLRTLLTPRELLNVLHAIEQEAGRERIIRWGPRTLDLDIIFYDDLIIEDEDLCIPHVDMQNRNFVLQPLLEIAPYKHHPCCGKTVQELYSLLLGSVDHS